VSLFPTRTAWTLALNNRLVAPPAYDESRAYFAIDGDRLVAYEIASGTQLWIASAAVTLRPAAGENLVFVVEPSMLTARHAADGSLAWALPLADAMATPPAWDNGWLVLATTTGAVITLRGVDGLVLWRQEIGSPAHAAPSLAADRVYVPTDDGRVVALNVETGAPVWERQLGGEPREILALDERLYVGSNDNSLYCLMAKDGRIDWRWRTGADVVGRPVADEHRVYFVALDNMLRGMDMVSGAQRWIKPLAIRPAWGPVRIGQTVIVAGQVQSLYAFATKDGAPAGDIAAGAELTAPPHVFENPQTKQPSLLVVTRHIAQGAAALLVTRATEPPVSPFAPLPNLTPIEIKTP